MPFSFIAPVVGAIGAADSVVNAVDTVGNWFDDGSGNPQQKPQSSGSNNNNSSSGGLGGSPIPNLAPQVIKGGPANFDFGGNFSNPVQGYAEGHQVHEYIPHNTSRGHMYVPWENFEFNPEDSFHFAEGGHTPEFFSEGGIKHRYVQGEGDGTSDSVPAMLANGEFVIPADIVSALGNGSNNSGASVLDQFLETIRTHKQEHDPKELPPDSKGPLEYLNISAVTKAK